MSSKVIVAGIHCSRTSRNQIHIEFKCDSSNVSFLDIQLSPEQFAMLITGAYLSEIPVTVSHLDRVGMTKVHEKRNVVFTGARNYDRDEQEQFIKDNCQEEGWIVNATLRSQTSVGYKDGKTILNYSVYKFVDDK